jgi:DNA (cytosine-5)-methyltransferase 1
MPPSKPTALTLFAGAGGADYGLAQAGFEHARCIEYDKHAHATLCAAGFPGVLGDVRDPRLYRNIPPIDLLWASPPCQDWSSAGKREGAKGSRNGWPWTWAVVRHLQRRGLGPRWFIAENVTGMLTHSGKDCGKGCCADPTRCPTTYWHEVVMREARALFPWADYRVIDAADYGTPQFRKRVFLVAGPKPIGWPTPTHGPPTTQVSMFGPGLRPWVTVRDALRLNGVVGSGLKGSEWTVLRPSPCVRDGNGTAGIFIRTEQRGATATPDTMPAPTVPTVGNQYLHASDPGVRLQREDTGRRRLTVEECAALFDMPADYPWQGTKTSKYTQIGNMVAWKCAAALAGAILDAES